MNSHSTTTSSSDSLRHDFTAYSKLLAEGADLMHKGANAEALAKFELAIKDCDYLTDAYAEAGKACMQLKQMDDAIQYYQQAMARHSSNLFVIKELANCYLKNKQTSDFNLHLQKAQAIAPREEKFRRDYYTDMRHFLAKKKYDDTDAAKIIHSAADDFSPALSNHAVIDAFLGEEAYKRNEIAVAFYHFTRATEKCRHDCYAENRRAEIFFLKLKRPTEGKEIIQRMINFYSHPVSLILHAVWIQNTAEMKSASFSAAFHEAQFFHFHSEIFHDEKLKIIILKSISSIKDIKTPSRAQQLQIDQYYKKIYPISLSGNLSVEERLHNQVILKNIIKMDPCNPIHYQAVGLNHWDKKNNKNDNLLAVAKLSLAMWLAHLAKDTKLLAELIHQRNFIESSMAAFEDERASLLAKKTVLEQHYEYRKYCSSGVEFVKQGYYHEGMSEYQKAIGLCPDLFDAYFLAAEVAEQAGNFSEALNFYLNVKKYYPQFPEIYNRLIKLYLRIKDTAHEALVITARHQYSHYDTAFKKRKTFYINQLKNILVTCPPSAEINSVIAALTENSLSIGQDKAIEYACLANMIMDANEEAAFFYHVEAMCLMRVDLISRYNY